MHCPEWYNGGLIPFQEKFSEYIDKGDNNLTLRETMIEYLLKNGDTPKRELAEIFETTTHQALEAKKEAKVKSACDLGPRIAYFDMETTGLRPEFDRIICASIYSYPSGEMVTYRIDETNHEDFADDRELALLVRDELERHHIISGWNSKGFDIPFLNTRLNAQGEKRVSSKLHIDAMYQYRGWRGVKPRNSRLSTVAEFWNLDERKMDVDGQVWVKAQGGNTKAINILCERCESDARLTAKIVAKTFEADLIRNIEKYG